MSDLPNQGDPNLVSRTIRVISYEEAIAGVERHVPVKNDEWDQSFWDYVDERKNVQLFFCEYRPGVKGIFCFQDHTGIWGGQLTGFNAKGRMQPSTIALLEEIARTKGLL